MDETPIRIAVATAVIVGVVGLWWFLRPETEEEKRLRRRGLSFVRTNNDMLTRPYFVEDSPTVIANLQRSLTNSSYRMVRLPDGTWGHVTS